MGSTCRRGWAGEVRRPRGRCGREPDGGGVAFAVEQAELGRGRGCEFVPGRSIVGNRRLGEPARHVRLPVQAVGARGVSQVNIDGGAWQSAQGDGNRNSVGVNRSAV